MVKYGKVIVLSFLVAGVVSAGVYFREPLMNGVLQAKNRAFGDSKTNQTTSVECNRPINPALEQKVESLRCNGVVQYGGCREYMYTQNGTNFMSSRSPVEFGLVSDYK